MKAIKRTTLCYSCDKCPEIIIYQDEVHIGEEDNLAKLKKQEWNFLVRKIKSGDLGVLA